MREIFEGLAPLFLMLALMIGAWVSYKKRSRKYILFLMIASLGYFGFFHHGCVCSVGSMQNLMAAFFDRSYIVPFIILTAFLLPLIATFFWGRVFCGGVCPLGAMQDLVNVYRLKIPAWLNPVLKLFPIVFFGLSIISVISGAGFLICKYDPFIGFLRLNGTFFMMVLGIIGMVLSIFISRPYCRYICPYSVLLSSISKFSRTSVSISPTECEKCHLCRDACPVDAIDKPTAVKSKETQRTGLSWMIIFIMLIPLWMTLFGIVGKRLAAPAHVVDRIIKLQEWQAKKATEKRAAEIEELIKETHKNDFAGMYVGALFGLIWGASLVSLTLKKERDKYEANKSDCIVCGRCYNYCPVEVEVRSKKSFKDKLLGHLTDRFILSSKIRKILSAGAIVVALIFIFSSFLLIQNIKDVDNYNILKQKDLIKLRAEIKKNKEDASLVDEYKNKESIAIQNYAKATGSHKKIIAQTLLLIFISTILLKISRSLSEPPEAVKKEPAGVSPTFSIYTRLGAVFLGLLLFTLGIVFTIRPF